MTSQTNKKPKVYVGMSGGVDSSVSALLLKLAGYDVTGVFIKVWQPEDDLLEDGTPGFKGECTWKAERRDAMRVTAVLNIPFLTFDFSERYKKEVVDYMIDEYRKGRTPNPDIMCNRHIKFGSFLDEALRQGADFVATGHYAQNIANQLHEGVDKNKDQSYFLYTLDTKDLEHTLFPIGHLQKAEVRKIAEKYKLPVFDKKDSQGICFLGHVDMKEFLKKYIDTKKGDVLDIHGTKIGEHNGALLYTIGERHGFTLHTSTPDDTPHYIVSKDMKNNTLTVVPQDIFQSGQYMPRQIDVFHMHWIAGTEPDLTKTYECRLRYRQERQTCTLKKVHSADHSHAYTIHFADPQKAITPGQSLVLYDGETCLGGDILSV